MPRDYQEALLRALADTNDLLQLQIELLIANLDDHVQQVEFHHRLERIKERRSTLAPIRPTPRLIQMGRVE